MESLVIPSGALLKLGGDPVLLKLGGDGTDGRTGGAYPWTLSLNLSLNLEPKPIQNVNPKP